MSFKTLVETSNAITPLNLTPTLEQQEIFTTFQNLLPMARTSETNLLVEALAGTGKTTTVIQLANLNPDVSFLMVCFNSKNAAELTKRCQKHGIYNLTALTLHKIAYDWYASETGKRPTNFLDVNWLVDNITWRIETEPKQQKNVAWNITKIVKDFCNSSYGSWSEFLKYNEELFKLGAASLTGAEMYIQEALNLNKTKSIPITLDGMIKVFELYNCPLTTSDKVIIIEEYQDINSNQASILAKQENFKIAIGDTNQNIYEWRGGGEFVSIVSEQNWTTKSLSSSFRTNAKDARLANILLKAINEDNLTLKGLSEKKTVETTAYLSRGNAAALIKAVELLNEKVEFALTLDLPVLWSELWYLHFLDKGDTKGKKAPTSLNWLKTKSDLAGAIEHSPEIKRLMGLLNLLNRMEGGLYGMQKKFEALAKATEGKVLPITLSTIHKAKGLEWDEVVLQDDVFDSLPSFELVGDRGEQMAALRLLYVAVTRAKVRTQMSEELEILIENFNF